MLQSWVEVPARACPRSSHPLEKTPETSEQTYPLLYRVPKTENMMQEDLSVRKLHKVLEDMRLRISVSRKCSGYGYGDE
jgi:hypothetical protein